jgi:hypothetical protein
MSPESKDQPTPPDNRPANIAFTATIATYASLKRVPVIPEPAALLVSAAVGVATYLLN